MREDIILCWSHKVKHGAVQQQGMANILLRKHEEISIITCWKWGEDLTVHHLSSFHSFILTLLYYGWPHIIWEEACAHNSKGCCQKVVIVSASNIRGWPLFHSESILEFFQLWPQTLLAFFGLWLPPSSRDTSQYFLFWAPSSSPQHYCCNILL